MKKKWKERFNEQAEDLVRRAQSSFGKVDSDKKLNTFLGIRKTIDAAKMVCAKF